MADKSKSGGSGGGERSKTPGVKRSEERRRSAKKQKRNSETKEKIRHSQVAARHPETLLSARKNGLFLK